MVQSYIQYLRNVLGIKSFVLPTDGQATNASTKFIFLMKPNSLNQNTKELLTKITAAMKLTEKDYQVFQLSQSEVSSSIDLISHAHAVICTDKDIYEYARLNFPHAEIILIPDLQSMIDQPQLKKQAWDQLRKLV